MAKDPARRWSMEQVREFLASPGAAAITPTVPVSREPAADGPTRMLRPAVAVPAATQAGPGATEPGPGVPEDRPAPARRRPSPRVLAVAGALVSILVVAAAVAALSGGGSRTPEPGTSASGGAAQVAAHPTAQGMEAFIRDYVTTVADDPDAAWQMLTPKFQRESGGLAHYRAFWDSATNGRVLDITADPGTLSVSYQVHFDHFRNGPGPTVLDLAYENGRYLIDGERTKGFVPAG
jgi:hypothetical protein